MTVTRQDERGSEHGVERRLKVSDFRFANRRRFYTEQDRRTDQWFEDQTVTHEARLARQDAEDAQRSTYVYDEDDLHVIASSQEPQENRW